MTTVPSFPPILHAMAAISVVLGAIVAALILLDEWRQPQKMWIMNVVWPITALFGSLLWLWLYWRHGRMRRDAEHRSGGGKRSPAEETPLHIAAAKGASHCGAGCTLGDIVAEWIAFAVPSVAVIFGWRWLFEEKTFAVWTLDFLLAFLLGIIFQYFTIKPMRDLSPGKALVQAVKADAASITSWQIGMYGVMAWIQFGWFRSSFGGIAPVNSFEFWFAMQLAMIAGFLTSYPVNYLLVTKGIKERM